MDLPLGHQLFEGAAVRRLECYDSPQQVLPLELGAEMIDRCLSEGGRCLVHCNAGQSRSASMVMIYFFMFKGHTLRASFEYVRGCKPDVKPNYGFWSQLEATEKELFGFSEPSLNSDGYKSETILELLEGSGKSKKDVLAALARFDGNGDLALWVVILNSDAVTLVCVHHHLNFRTQNIA
ncbi:hypothetical protein THAOC_05682 [Thalassiosira oceanica]|uniref:Tyrosine specific protein phosphatases domain-containing protein n=1 Tax=Thalassiosira oceanica TaxID=159749 RepID=K0TMK5_THAOC|nr:hypothetical protein THAOC_05682 [Thalassiosira oceanica]|eukprot:EJK72752.1 hypothetical protein THAOC_05682 [Thalassiosira oceanica]